MLSDSILRAFTLKNSLKLLRPAAVLCSSVAIIFSGVFPLAVYYELSVSSLVTTSLLLLIGCILIHGVLTHALNDYADYLSGTDQLSPAMLSGGSRVIQEGRISPAALHRFGIGLTIVLVAAAAIIALFGHYALAALLLIGIWGAVSYSLPPLRFSYAPLAGEWLSTFPSTFFLGLGGAWLMLGTFPQWAVQNALINALYCVAWVMVHHIPDVDADRQATPVKRTSVVWAADRWGIGYSRLPALVYLGLIALCVIWLLGTGRLWGGAGIAVMVALSVYWICRMDVRDPEQVTNCEKKLLLLAVGGAVWLGIFI
ncbi:prenyltransferase [Paenibacillus dauci]|uniref:prenyltransferase n=1 Tax=Paenibacillus dauci TaxID=1567106 RepID=UPI000619FF8B|nr:prenyltransferase [Paenibacillus dauci]